MEPGGIGGVEATLVSIACIACSVAWAGPAVIRLETGLLLLPGVLSAVASGMALLRIPQEGRVVSDPEAIRSHLSAHGIWYEQWPVAGRVDRQATAEQILAAYAPEVDRLKARGGYITADVIDVTADVPGLQAMLDKFNKEHTHAEDEVRFIVRGSGVFHIHPNQGPIFAIEVMAGDLINVPAGTLHWFDLCADRDIRAIRLFREKAGWTPVYSGSDVAVGYQPLCFGPSYLPAGTPRAATLPELSA